MATAGELITGSLRLIGILGEGEAANSDTANDALTAMNQMIDSWSTERLSIYATQDQQFTWPASTISRTLGPTGQLVGVRPILLEDSTYFKVNNLSYSIQQINQEQYSGIALKTATSTYPQVMFVNMDMPNITVYLYPVPTSSLEFHFISVDELTQPALLSTTLSFPPGYLRAFRFNLACELAAEFGLEAPPTVKRIADVSKRNIKRINNPNDVMSMPFPMVYRNARFNIFTGTNCCCRSRSMSAK